MIGRLADALLGDKRANSETRHRPRWWPRDFDRRWLGDRLAVMDIPPYKPPYRRHIRIKAWVCAGPGYIIHLVVIAELDLDRGTLDVEVYR
jgi:hypothetical protein